MRYSLKTICLLTLCFGLLDCHRENVDPGNRVDCVFERFSFYQSSSSDSSYRLQYNTTTGKLEQVEKQYLSGTNWITKETYKHTYKIDTVIITRIPEGNTVLLCLFDKGKIKEVKNYTKTPGYSYRYRFDYSVANQVSVKLEYVSSSTAEYLAQAVYVLDSKGNATQQKIFKAPNPDVVFQDKTFTFDPSRNPVRGIIVPNFLKNTPPDVSYFSASNKTKEEYAGVTNTFGVKYNDYLLPSEIITSDGMVLAYSYVCASL